MVKIILLALVLVGCGSTPDKPPRVDVTEVNIPVFTCPSNINQLVDFNRPVLYIHQLTTEQTTNPGQVAQSYVLTVKQLQQYAEQLELQLTGVQLNCSSLNTNPITE